MIAVAWPRSRPPRRASAADVSLELGDAAGVRLGNATALAGRVTAPARRSPAGPSGSSSARTRSTATGPARRAR